MQKLNIVDLLLNKNYSSILLVHCIEVCDSTWE